jgi:hypothetical protein
VLDPPYPITSKNESSNCLVRLGVARRLFRDLARVDADEWKIVSHGTLAGAV